MSKRPFAFLVSAVVNLMMIFTACKTLPPLNLTERDLELSLEHGGYTRDFILHLPVNHKTISTMPLVIALHGGGGTAKGMIRLTRGRFNELADAYGFLVVYPQGLEKSWNDGRNDPISFAHENNIDDIGFLSKVIETAIQRYNADPEMIFVTGISNGGFMSFRVSRELAHLVKAVAPVTASIPVSTRTEHLSAPPVSIMLLNGTADPLVPYKGGHVEVLGKKRGNITSADETIDIFTKRNDCAVSPEVTDLNDRDPDDGTRVIRYAYANPETGRMVVLLKIINGGHTWPGGWQYLGEKFIGKTSMDINACDEIWEFFSSLR
jgi:polyhydroxybutyrate depolymerase